MRGQITKAGGNSSITGYVRLPDNTPIEGVTISDGTHVSLTSNTGQFTFFNVINGAYQLTATKAGYTFEPEVGVTPYIVNSQDVFFRNFKATSTVRPIGTVIPTAIPEIIQPLKEILMVTVNMMPLSLEMVIL